MQVGKTLAALIAVSAFWISSSITLNATPRKVHVVALGAGKRVPYSKSGDPAGALPGENTLKIRPLIVDGNVKEWTTGDAHDVTDRSFAIRRVLKINDELPGEQTAAGNHWVWQRGPWLLIDRVSGHVSALKLPDYDPGGESGELVPRLCSVLRGHLERKESLCGCRPTRGAQTRACQETFGVRTGDTAAPHMRRSGMATQATPRTFHPAGMDAVSFDIVGGSAVLVEDSDEAPESASPAKTKLRTCACRPLVADSGYRLREKGTSRDPHHFFRKVVDRLARSWDSVYGQHRKAVNHGPRCDHRRPHFRLA